MLLLPTIKGNGYYFLPASGRVPKPSSSRRFIKLSWDKSFSRGFYNIFEGPIKYFSFDTSQVIRRGSQVYEMKEVCGNYLTVAKAEINNGGMKCRLHLFKQGVYKDCSPRVDG